MTRKDEGHYVLSTGRVVSANRGIIGLASDRDDVSEGYDGGIRFGDDLDDLEDIWTVEERRELGAFMIARWTACWTEAQK